VIRALFITPLFASGNRQPLDFAAGYLFELRLPALSGLGDEEQDQAVPLFAELVVSRTFDTARMRSTYLVD
jgi:hypothetical protein